MCESNLLTSIVSVLYWILCFAIPLLYLYAFARYKSKRKNYKRAFLIAIVMFLVLFSVKWIVRMDVSFLKCPNCYINNQCLDKKEKTMESEKEEKEEEVSSMEERTTTTITSTTSKPISTTTTKKILKEKEYAKVSEISGTKKDLGKTSKGFSIYEIDGVTYVDGYLIANKSYILPSTFVPTDTYAKADGNATKQCANCINNTAYNAWKDMKADAAAVGLNIYISSGFRSYITQSNIYNRNVSKNGQAKADTYSARPGSSEHQTGLCFDLNTIDEAFARTNEGKWVAQNAYKYGYIIRYPEGKTNETGYIYESWHLRYVGTELAEKLYNNGNWITMEDYFGISSKYAN